MSDWGNPQAPVLPLFISPYTQYGNALDHGNVSTTSPTLAAVTWVANLISYAPITLPFPYPVKRAFWINGSTITSTNVDFGVYSWEGTLIYNTGSTAMSGASSVQYVTPGTDFILDAGRYYLAWSCNNTTSRGMAGGTAAAQFGRLSGMLEETPGGFGLPASMTAVAWARAWGPSMCGFTRTTTGF